MVMNQWRESEEADDGLSDKPSCSSSSPWIRVGIPNPENPTMPGLFNPGMESG
ncbi:hypothetical protein HanRHA438_Chr11g0490091 [Helianthus annuus]|nr:hypothetical protein HanHA300_Chr11g0390851 [Helianthus annuus]KAJ0508126.1 hypothetical protein HanIR_Chr11g0513831 [Helianthus annuus]KAJ0516438.1 hypothetical protein HanHA89_Chr11g0413871 [Helianthus annuus]KAJ0684440.1 hypothetical protein HanLR1_Chr11g0391211 [Helianthus annuus]KAJ0869526.1 hypothetical protein HanRHA438_Chr11g0490091 [Helianthus annuus]